MPGSWTEKRNGLSRWRTHPLLIAQLQRGFIRYSIAGSGSGSRHARHARRRRSATRVPTFLLTMQDVSKRRARREQTKQSEVRRDDRPSTRQFVVLQAPATGRRRKAVRRRRVRAAHLTPTNCSGSRGVGYATQRLRCACDVRRRQPNASASIDPSRSHASQSRLRPAYCTVRRETSPRAEI